MQDIQTKIHETITRYVNERRMFTIWDVTADLKRNNVQCSHHSIKDSAHRIAISIGSQNGYDRKSMRINGNDAYVYYHTDDDDPDDYDPLANHQEAAPASIPSVVQEMANIIVTQQPSFGSLEHILSFAPLTVRTLGGIDAGVRVIERDVTFHQMLEGIEHPTINDADASGIVAPRTGEQAPPTVQAIVKPEPFTKNVTSNGDLLVPKKFVQAIGASPKDRVYVYFGNNKIYLSLGGGGNNIKTEYAVDKSNNVRIGSAILADAGIFSETCRISLVDGEIVVRNA